MSVLGIWWFSYKKIPSNILVYELHYSHYLPDNGVGELGR